MANVKISQLTAITSSDDLADADIVPIVDSSDSTTKRAALSVLCSYFGAGGGGGSSVWCTGTNTVYLLTDCVGIGTATPGTDIMLRVQGDSCYTGDLKVAGDVCIGGDDLFMGTNTSGHMLVADGTNFNPVAMSGDIGINGSGVTTIQAGAVENSMLAGSIANAKLSNSSVSYGGVSLSLGGTDATPAFNLCDATGYKTTNLAGTITNDQLAGSISNDKLAGSIANAKLANDSVSYGGVEVDLGSTDATPAFNLCDATGYQTSNLAGTITNAQLAGSIANSKLANDSVSYGGVSLDLGETDATPAFNLCDATGYKTTNLAGTITNAQLAGSIANAKLSNSSVSYGGVSLSLGGTDATPAFNLCDATAYPTSSLVGTITNAQLAGSIANSKLANDSVSYGGVSVDLGATDDTPAFNLCDATGYKTTNLAGTITNSQLAGSIANAKLSNNSVSYGGVEVALGATDATPAFNLCDATGYQTSSLAGTITNAQLAGSIANSKLANDSVSYGGVSLDLGQTDASPAFNLCDATGYKGDSALVTVGTIASGVWNGTAIATTHVAGTLCDKTLASPVLCGTISGDAFLDEDNMASNSATKVASQQSIKAYVDSVATGLDLKCSSHVATTANLSATYNNGSSGVGATLTNNSTQAALSIDGQTMVADERVLVKDQSTGAQNGIYTVTTVGDGSTNWVLTRATDFDTSTEITSGAFTFVETGSTNADSGFVLTTDGSITVGTTALTWSQFSGAGQITAGNGLTKSGNTLNVGAGSNLLVSSDAVAMCSIITGLTTVCATNFAGTLATAAQTNVTSLGTLTALTVDNISINGTTIGHTDDTDLITLADGSVTIAGDLTISGDDLTMGTNTSGHILVADGTNYNPVAVSGDVTINGSGAVTIADNAVENSMLAGSIANAKLSNSSVSYGGVSVALGATDATPAFNLCDATGYQTSNLAGTITNAQLAGSIANSKLSNDSVSYGGVSVDLGAADATPAFNLCDATGYKTSNLAGTITNAQLAGSIANAKLSNSSITVTDGSSSTAISLGGTVTFSGTSNEVEVGESSGTITVGLPAIVSGLTTVCATNFAGTLATAAQTNITSLGTLTALTVDNVSINGATIGHTDDTDLITLADGSVTIAGDLTVSGDDLTMGTNTAGHILVADGTNYNPVAVSGDITINSAGAVTIAATSVENSMLAGSIANAKLSNSSVSYGGVELALGATDATPAFNLCDATGYQTSNLAGTITNSQLAGSIANSKLSNDSVSYGGVEVDLGATDATPAFNLCDATGYKTSNLAGTITNAQLAGSIANDKLAGSIANAKLSNSSITVCGAGSNSTAISLGGAVTFAGTSNEIEVAESSGTVTIGLPSIITGLTTVCATNFAGTLATAAQTNVTSLGTLTALTVDNVSINGATIGHTDDTDLITLADGAVTIAGDLTISGDDITMGTNTAGHILVADGTNYNPVAVSGDITINSAGAVTIASSSVENSMLAGSIANAKLANDSVSFGGVSVDLGAADATPAFNLCDATAYKGDSALVTSGALNSGSITSGFGNIDNGSSTLTTGAATVSSLSVGDGNITNVGDIAVDTISGDADSNTTIGFPGSDVLTFNTGGNERVRIDASGDVGIGTTSIASGGTDTRNVTIHNSNSQATYFKLSNNATGTTNSDGFDLISGADGQAYVYNRENAILNFATNSTIAAKILANGDFTVDDKLFVDVSASRVGINTTSPQSEFEISSGDGRTTLTINETTAFADDTVRAMVSFEGIMDTDARGQYAYISAISTAGTYGAGELAFGVRKTSGGSITELLRLADTGNVGIATTAPCTTLHSYGTATIGKGQAVNEKALVVLTSTTSAGYGGQIQFQKNNSSLAEIGHESAILGSGTSNDLYLQSDNSIDFAAGGTTQQVTIDSSGKVAIGENVSPRGTAFYEGGHSTALQIEGTTPTTSSLSLVRANANYGPNLILGRTCGSVGGNDSVAANQSLGGVTWQANDGTDFINAAMIEGRTGNHMASDCASGELRFYTNAGSNGSTSVRMVIDEDGNVGIGTTAPVAAFHLNNGASVTNLPAHTRAVFANTNSANAITRVGIYAGGASAFSVLDLGRNDANCRSSFTYNASADSLTIGTAGSASALAITTAGEVYIQNSSDQGSYNLQVGGTGVWAAGAYVNGSDETLKQSIEAYNDNALDIVSEMKPVTFEYKKSYSDDRARQIGFIAQDLQKVLKGKNYLSGVVKDDNEHLNVAYQSLIPILTKALQEAVTKIETLENKVAVLEATS